LVTKEVTEIVGEDAGIRFEPDGPAQLKGVAAPVDLFRAER
jgi:class 3 adenylate cyclase